MKSKTPIRHGHQGNRKNAIVEWTYSDEEIEDAKKEGVTLNTAWKASPPLTLKSATELYRRLKRMDYKARIKKYVKPQAIQAAWKDRAGNTQIHKFSSHADAWDLVLLYEDAIETTLHIAPTNSGDVNFNYIAERQAILLELEDCDCSDCLAGKKTSQEKRKARNSHYGQELIRYHLADEIQLMRKREARAK